MAYTYNRSAAQSKKALLQPTGTIKALYGTLPNVVRLADSLDGTLEELIRDELQRGIDESNKARVSRQLGRANVLARDLQKMAGAVAEIVEQLAGSIARQ
jgi:hypothetical protein